MNDLEQKQKRMTLANRLRSVREQKGLNQDQAAAAMGCSQANISKYENGLATADLDTVVLFADAYGCSIDYLLGRDVFDHNTRTLRGRLLAAFEELPGDDQQVYLLIVETIVAAHRKK